MANIKKVLNNIYNYLTPYPLFIYKWCKLHRVLSYIILLSLIGLLDYFLPTYPSSLDSIKNRGVLKIVASNEPLVQHALSNHYYGFEYDLLAEYAASIDVKLEIIPVAYGELFQYLNSGKADIAIGGIISSELTSKLSTPTIEWYQLTPTITYHRKQNRLKNLEQFGDKKVYIPARFFKTPVLEKLNNIEANDSEYSLISKVNDGTIEHALSSNYKAKQAKHYFPNVNRAFLMQDKLGLVWALPRWHNKVFLENINNFLKQAKKQNLPKKYAQQYLENYKKVDLADLLNMQKRIHKVLPKYKTLFKKAANASDIDWYLLAAMAYQESHWSNRVTSPTGVKGIMQITKETAKYLGVEDRLNQRVSIYAAARYVKYLYNRLPDTIQEPDRIWFAVAAYNAGLKHIIRAHSKAKRLGLNANDWETVANQSLIYLYTDEDDNKKTFSQGLQAKKYVDRVQVFTDILRFHSIYPEL